MRSIVSIAAITLGITGLLVASAGQQGGTRPSGGRVPVLAELFTSEGCSSCPAADDLLRHLLADQPIEGVEIIGLSEHVDYWDRLGWKDPFSSFRFTERQGTYARAIGAGRLYTPMLVIDGRFEVVGSDWPAVRRAVVESARQPRVSVQVSASRSMPGDVASVRVVARSVPFHGKSIGARVVVAVIEDDLIVDVDRGENARKRLRHSAVVRTLETIGTVEENATAAEVGGQISLDSSWQNRRLRIVAFVQNSRTHAVLGVGTASLAP